ncbi:MAG TPA: VanW family protein [Candidatus Limnocylindrales bacterium]|nr:VanW family protein [Candidatus Limnocylindrales bacterium]
MRLSTLHPALYAARVRELQLERLLADRRHRVPFARTHAETDLPILVIGHRSILRRRLGDTDPRLQETKIVNLRLAAATIDRVVIRPGEVLSFWERVGRPTADRGFVDGLVLRNGGVGTAVGGGLCQLSNLVYWMALHAPLDVVERHHHGFDPFPDHGRVLPFGSGATVFYNYGDLRLRNPTDQPFELRAWVTDRHLCGRISTDRPWPLAYHVEERDHAFHRAADGRIYRDNELWRRAVDRATGQTVELVRITSNHAEVKYAAGELADRRTVAAAAVGQPIGR